MLTALIFANVAFHQDPQPKIVDERARAVVVSLFESLPLGVYVDDCIEAARSVTFIGKSASSQAWTTSRELFYLNYFPDEETVFSVAFRWPEKPFTTQGVSTEQATDVASQCASAILPNFGAWEIDLVYVVETEYYFYATPMIGDMLTHESVGVEVRRSDGLPKSIVRSSQMLDYSVFLGKQYITKERALLVGLNAYNRFRPYNACVVDSVRLRLGPPMWHAEIPHEIRQEDFDYMNRKIALPLYRISIADRHRTGRVQHVYVHAIEGRALSVWANSGFSAGSAIESSLSDAIVEAKFGEGKESVTLSPTTERMEKLDEGLPVVALSIGDAVYAARVDNEHERIWLWTDKQWAAYTIDADAFKLLVRSAVKPGTFGKRTGKKHGKQHHARV